MSRSKKVSQAQLAKELGVSQALISTVLNGHKEGVSEDTYQRVWAHAVKRGYHPKGMRLAVSPAARTRQVAVIVRAPLRLYAPSVYFEQVQYGLQAALEARGSSAVYVGAEDQFGGDKLQNLFAPGHPFSGVILVGEMRRPFLDALRRFKLRLVAVSARCPGLCHSVVGNEPQALEMLVQHLVELGHSRLGWIGGNVGKGLHESRLQAFESALVRFDLQVPPRFVIKLEEGDRAEGVEAVHRLMPHARRKDFPTAFICYNAAMAAGAIKALAREGRRVPQDISLASADFSPLALRNKPSITAAGSDPDKLGEAAARLVLENTGIDDGRYIDVMLPAQLHVGETTAAVAAAGR